MINPIDRILSAISPQRALVRAIARDKLRLLESRNQGYDAAGKGRRNTWVRGSDNSQNAENRNALTLLRARHRDLVRNNPYAASAVNVRVAYTVGDGIMPTASHPTSKRKQDLANKLMREWASSTGCDVEGRLNLAAMESLAFRAISESGEALLMRQIVNVPRGQIPLRLRLLEGDYIDHSKDGIPGGGLNWVQGVGIDENTFQRRQYQLFKTHPGDRGARTSSPTSADGIAHGFDMVRPGQVRGLPAGVAAMTRLRNLDDFQDARLETQKIAALLGVIARSDKGDNVLPEKLEPGMLAVLSSGGDEDIQTITPPSVSGQHEFVVEEARLIAKAYGITYEALVGDLSGVNFTSGKMGRTDMLLNVRAWRKHIMINQLLNPIGEWFLQAAELAGYDLSGVQFLWVAPRLEMVDAERETKPVISQIRSGIGAFSTHMRTLGYDDPQAELLRAAQDFELMDQLGLRLDCDPRNTTTSGQAQSDNPLTDSTDPDNGDSNAP
ncbi:MAG: phage portal protein [Porticoccus sp.]|uniref:phage portal protein n=1 Tax=Porticoccus sp. TaxID=2024853 RepID=UPI00329A0C3B